MSVSETERPWCKSKRGSQFAMNKTPRRVSVYIGRPDGLEDEDIQAEADEVHTASPDECYTIEFVEEGEEEGFMAQVVCLCSLTAATEAWLNGKSMEEVQAVMISLEDKHDESDNGHG